MKRGVQKINPGMVGQYVNLGYVSEFIAHKVHTSVLPCRSILHSLGREHWPEAKQELSHAVMLAPSTQEAHSNL
jgi:hypothetical protein